MKKQALTARKTSRFDRAYNGEAFLLNGTPPDLEEIVNKHRVTWELWPVYHLDRDGKRIQIGFEFCLVGGHQHSGFMVEPGCPECMTIHEDLRWIAEWLVPEERRKGKYDILIADSSPYYSSHRRFRPEVFLIIRVINREGFEEDMDPSKIKCLMAMKSRAKELGIPRHQGTSLSTEVSPETH